MRKGHGERAAQRSTFGACYRHFRSVPANVGAAGIDERVRHVFAVHGHLRDPFVTFPARSVDYFNPV
jgi:hypothetical protein